MIRMDEIRPLTDFLRNHKAHVRRLKKGRRPEVLTINGRAEIVIQDAASYQELVLALEQAEAVAGIRRGLESVEQGEGKPLAQFAAEQAKKKRKRKA